VGAWITMGMTRKASLWLTKVLEFRLSPRLWHISTLLEEDVACLAFGREEEI